MPPKSVNRPAGTQTILALCALLALPGCASKYSQVPPRLDLAPYGQVALVTFAADQSSHAGMSELASRRFAEALLSAQPGVELLEVEPGDSALRGIPANDAPAMAKALGRQKDVPAVFVGYLEVSGMRPKGHFNTAGVNLRATVSAELSVRLLSTRTGATLWRSTSASEGTVGRVNVSGGLPAVAVRDQEEASGEVVRELVAGVSRDLRPTWVKQ